MDDAQRVRSAQAGGDLAGPQRDLLPVAAGTLAQPLEQRLALDELHRDALAAIGELHHVVDATHVRAGDASRHAHLALEPLQLGDVAVELVGQDLERDQLVQLAIAGLVDLPHPAAAQAAEDLEALAHPHGEISVGIEEGVGRGVTWRWLTGTRHAGYATLSRPRRHLRTDRRGADYCTSRSRNSAYRSGSSPARNRYSATPLNSTAPPRPPR